MLICFYLTPFNTIYYVHSTKFCRILKSVQNYFFSPDGSNLWNAVYVCFLTFYWIIILSVQSQVRQKHPLSLSHTHSHILFFFLTLLWVWLIAGCPHAQLTWHQSQNPMAPARKYTHTCTCCPVTEITLSHQPPTSSVIHIIGCVCVCVVPIYLSCLKQNSSRIYNTVQYMRKKIKKLNTAWFMNFFGHFYLIFYSIFYYYRAFWNGDILHSRCVLQLPVCVCSYRQTIYFFLLYLLVLRCLKMFLI